MNRPALHYMRTIASPSAAVSAASSSRTWIAVPSALEPAISLPSALIAPASQVDSSSPSNPERGLGIPFVERWGASEGVAAASSTQPAAATEYLGKLPDDQFQEAARNAVVQAPPQEKAGLLGGLLSALSGRAGNAGASTDAIEMVNTGHAVGSTKTGVIKRLFSRSP